MIKVEDKTGSVELLSIDDAAARSGLSRSGVYLAIRLGQLASVQLGKRVHLITRGSFDAWLASRS